MVEIAGQRIYHAGDTDLIEEMKPLKDLNIDVAMLPVGATYTMNPSQAATATQWIQPKLAIPMHWNNTTQDSLIKTLVPNAACPVKIMTAGEGGAWGIALLAAYLLEKPQAGSLEAFLSGRVFSGQAGTTLAPEPHAVAGFLQFMERYKQGLAIERAAVQALK